ncbi:MAG: hypothetical protein HUJ18_00085, partial [Marinobacter sp.]|nr:hypothetical protein [Marinobacter sp.]
MRWLALLLLCVNLMLWYFAGVLQPPDRSSETLSGTLPRVASLKSPAEPEAPPEVSAPDPDVRSAKAAASDAMPASPEPVPVGPPLQCVRMGWLESREAARAILSGMTALEDVVVEIEEVERERPPLNWVLIPPQPPEAARRQFRDIQRQGIDSYLVTEGEYRNAISLGLFESREAAISVLEEKKRQNLNAVLANYDRNQISYALDFEAEPDLAEDLVQAVTSEYGKNFDFIEINPCEGVATS